MSPPSNRTTRLREFDWRGRRCLVTGGSGFVGTAVCRRLTSLGADVWVVARRAQPSHAFGHWLQCDVTEAAAVREVMGACRPEVVFHLASIVAGARKLELVLPMLHSNLTAFLNVAIAGAELGCERIVTAGSLQEPDHELLGVPSSPYAAAKLAASGYARMLANTFGVPVVIARLFMIYGPGQQDVTKLVPHVLSQLLAGKKAALSSGKQEFDWVYIEDVCDALIAIASHDDLVGRTIDVGTGVLTSVLDVAQGLARRLDALDLLEVGAIPDRFGDPRRVADTATAKALTGWESRIALERGLDLTASWFSERRKL